MQLDFNQAWLIEGQRRVLVCSGQTAVNAQVRPQQSGDLGAPLSVALDNLNPRVRPTVTVTECKELANRQEYRCQSKPVVPNVC